MGRSRGLGTGLLLTTMLVAGVQLMASAASSSSAPSLGPGEPWIVYQGGDSIDGTWPIRLVRPDGTDDHLLPLEGLPGYDQGHAAWSPDGSRISFDLFTEVPGSPDRVTIWAVEPDGGSATELGTCTLPCLQLAYPAWSPDGRELALSRYDFAADGTWGRSAVEMLDVMSGERRVLTETADGTTAFYTPRWSPDGSAIVFVIESYPDATQQSTTSSVLAMIPTDGSSTSPTVLTSSDIVASAPDWGPSDRIAFTRSDSVEQLVETATIATIASDGTDLRPYEVMDVGLAFAIEPTWTADGRLLVGTGDLATGTQWLAWVEPETGSAERLPWDLVTAPPGIQRTHHHLRPAG